jgi:AcrR family transcriptional regulator
VRAGIFVAVERSTTKNGTPRRRLPSQERRDLVLAAAREVFARSGLAGATMGDIGKAAGIDPALLYRHFNNKDDIFEAAVAQPLEAAAAEWTRIAGNGAAFAADGDLERDLVAGEVAEMVAKIADLTPLLGIILFSDRGPDFYAAHFAPALATFTTALEAAKPKWEHRDFDPKLIACVIFGAAIIAGLDQKFTGREDDLAQLAHDINELILDGIRPR